MGGEQVLPLLVVHFVPLDEQEAASISKCWAQGRRKALCVGNPSSSAACTLLLQIRNTVQTLTLICSAGKTAFSLENVIKMGSGFISIPEAELVTEASRATAL